MIELIVVIVLMSMLFAFTMPRLGGYLFKSDTKKVSRWIVVMVGNLKTKAVSEQLRYVLHADSSANKFWISHGSMDEEALIKAAEDGYKLPGDVKIKGVLPPRDTGDSPETIVFYKKGYSEKAVIHIEGEDGDSLYFLIEPFLPGVEITDDYKMR